MNRADRIHAAQLRAIREKVDGFTRQQFTGQADYRDASQAEFVRRVVPVVLAARQQVSTLTDAYLSQALTTLLGRQVQQRGPIATDHLRMVSAAEVYSRPHRLVWWHLSKDATALQSGITAGLARVSELVAADLQLSQTTTAAACLRTVDGVAMRRQPTTGDSCPLCTADTRHEYTAGELLPHHPGCSCVPTPVLAGSLGTTRPDAVRIEHHGELGPLLRPAPAAPTGSAA